MRDLSQGRHFYAGPKRLALFRLMRLAAIQGPVVVVVFPVSPPYMAELVTPKDRAGFENLLAEVRAEFPRAQWVRLDRVPGLDSAEFFYDLVHLNMRGRRVATQAFLDAVRPPLIPR